MHGNLPSCCAQTFFVPSITKTRAYERSRFPEAKVEVVLLKLQSIGHAQVSERPVAIAKVEIFGAILQPYTDVALRFAENLVWVVLAAIQHGRIFFPLDARVAANPGNDAAELIGHLPSGIERADSAGRESGDRAAVAVLAEVVLRGDFGEHFIAEKADIAIADGIVQGAAHRVFETTVPFLGICFHEVVGRRAG